MDAQWGAPFRSGQRLSPTPPAQGRLFAAAQIYSGLYNDRLQKFRLIKKN